MLHMLHTVEALLVVSIHAVCDALYLHYVRTHGEADRE